MIPDIFFEHGGRKRAAAAIFPDAPKPWVDLSTGVSPFAYPAPAASNRLLPDAESIAELESAAAAAFGVRDSSRVIALPGSDLALRILAPILDAGTVRAERFTYGGHEEIWRHFGARIRRRGAADVVILVNPNNPDGRILDKAAIGQRIDAKHWLVVDEAFADLDPAISIAGETWRRLIVLRSFGKFYGLPGIRLGFIIGPRRIIGSLRAIAGAWPVSNQAIAAGIAAYRDPDWSAAIRRRLTRSRKRLDALLDAAGFEAAGGTDLFRLVRHSRARTRFLFLARQGILVRPFREKADYLRFGLPGDRQSWQRLKEGLEAL